MKIQSKPSKRSTRKKTKISKEPDIGHYPELKDQFQQQTVEVEKQHLREEHELRLMAQKKLHEARMSSVLTELQTQLYRIWNDMWLQRQKSMNDGFKQWLKVFSAG